MFIDKITSIISLTPPVANQPGLVQLVYNNDQGTFDELVKLFPNGTVVPEISFTTTYKNVRLDSASYAGAALAVETVSYSNFSVGEVSEDVSDEEAKSKAQFEIETLNGDVKRATENFDKVSAELSGKDAEIASANETIAKLTADIESLKVTLEEANADRQAQANVVAELRAAAEAAAAQQTTPATATTDPVDPIKVPVEDDAPIVNKTGTSEEPVTLDAPTTTPTPTTKNRK